MPLRNVPKTLGPASACRHCAPVRQHQPSRIHGDPGTSTCRRALEPLMDMDHGTHGIPCVHSRAGINLDLQSRVVWFGGSSPNGQDNSEWMTVTWICATMIQSHWRSVAQSEPTAQRICVKFWVVKTSQKRLGHLLWKPLGWRSITTDHRDHGMYPTKWGTSRIDNMILWYTTTLSEETSNFNYAISAAFGGSPQNYHNCAQFFSLI